MKLNNKHVARGLKLNQPILMNAVYPTATWLVTCKYGWEGCKRTSTKLSSTRLVGCDWIPPTWSNTPASTGPGIWKPSGGKTQDWLPLVLRNYVVTLPLDLFYTMAAWCRFSARWGGSWWGTQEAALLWLPAVQDDNIQWWSEAEYWVVECLERFLLRFFFVQSVSF